MCIWKVAECDRLCQYCSYRDGCEVYPTIDVPNADELYAKYKEIMMSVTGIDIGVMCRRSEYVYTRYFVVHRLYIDGVSPREIERVVGLDRCTTIHARKKVEYILKHRSMFLKENKIYEEFIKKI